MSTRCRVFCTECSTQNIFQSKYCFNCGHELQKKVLHDDIIDLATPPPPSPPLKGEHIKNIKTDTQTASTTATHTPATTQLTQIPSTTQINPPLNHRNDDTASISTPYFLNTTLALPPLGGLMGANHSQLTSPPIPLLSSLQSLCSSALQCPSTSSLEHLNQSQSTASLPSSSATHAVQGDPYRNTSIASFPFVLGNDGTQSVRYTTEQPNTTTSSRESDGPTSLVCPKSFANSNTNRINTNNAQCIISDDLDTTTHRIAEKCVDKRLKKQEPLKPIIKAASRHCSKRMMRWKEWEVDCVKEEWKKLNDSSPEIENTQRSVIISHRLSNETSFRVEQSSVRLTKAPWRTSTAVYAKLKGLDLVHTKGKKRKTNSKYCTRSRKRRRFNKWEA